MEALAPGTWKSGQQVTRAGHHDDSGVDVDNLSPRSRDLGRHHAAELIRRIRELGAWLGEHGDELQEVLSQIPGETLVPALRQLVDVARRMGVEARLSPELRAVLDQMGRQA